MPTSVEEAHNIVRIMNDFLSYEQAVEITKRLNEEVGTKTDNMSLKVSLEMLKELYEKMPPPVPPPHDDNDSLRGAARIAHNNVDAFNKSPLFMKVAFLSLVSFHMLVLFGNLISLLVLPWFTPWYIALPVISLLVNFMFSSVPCPLTRLESVLRRNMGMPEIDYFIQHYFYKPSWRRTRLTNEEIHAKMRRLQREVNKIR